MERMNTLDAGFFFVEHQNVPMHIGSLAVFEGPAPAYRDLRGLYRREAAAGAALPAGGADAAAAGLPPVLGRRREFRPRLPRAACRGADAGGPGQLRDMSARIFAQRLDRARPLWEAWFLEGIEDGRWAMLSKVHHCMVDGIGGTDLMAALFELEPRVGAAGCRCLGPRAGAVRAELIAGGARDTLDLAGRGSWPSCRASCAGGCPARPICCASAAD